MWAPEARRIRRRTTTATGPIGHDSLISPGSEGQASLSPPGRLRFAARPDLAGRRRLLPFCRQFADGGLCLHLDGNRWSRWRRLDRRRDSHGSRRKQEEPQSTSAEQEDDQPHSDHCDDSKREAGRSCATRGLRSRIHPMMQWDTAFRTRVLVGADRLSTGRACCHGWPRWQRRTADSKSQKAKRTPGAVRSNRCSSTPHFSCKYLSRFGGQVSIHTAILIGRLLNRLVVRAAASHRDFTVFRGKNPSARTVH